MQQKTELELNEKLPNIALYVKINKLSFHVNKSQFMVF